MDQLPKRKQNRLPDFDYGTPHVYFLTICTQNKTCVLGRIPKQSSEDPPQPILSKYGKVVEAAICAIPMKYACVKLDNYVVMPNHIHLLLCLEETDENCLTVSHIIQQMKGYVTKQLGKSIWQKSFHDHVVRGKEDYLEIWQYIENNPLKWTLDRYYQE